MSSTQVIDSLVPTLSAKWKRSVTSKDVAPSFILEDSNEICSVCRKNGSRYTCPRCKIPYCSVACYQKHDSSAEGSCTESFYKDRVSSVLQVEANEHPIHDILNRHANEEEDLYNDEELCKLADALEQGTLDNETLSTKMRLAFERAVNSGELNDVVLNSWHPWWMPDFSIQQDAIDERPMLDDRLLKIPPFSSLYKTGVVPSLEYNLVDILYSIAFTLRLYHGVDNAKTTCPEAADTLIQTSAVLCEDARYTTVAEALMRCITNNTGNTHWTVLARDVALLCVNSRHVALALLEAIDVTKAATRTIKDQQDDSTRMRRIRKKLEFYLSWSRQVQLPPTLCDEIRAWMDEWKGPKDSQVDDSLWLPSEYRTQSTQGDRKKGDLLLTEVSSKRTGE